LRAEGGARDAGRDPDGGRTLRLDAELTGDTNPRLTFERHVRGEALVEKDATASNCIMLVLPLMQLVCCMAESAEPAPPQR